VSVTSAESGISDASVRSDTVDSGTCDDSATFSESAEPDTSNEFDDSDTTESGISNRSDECNILSDFRTAAV
jgi:hypothetical protein